MSEKEIQDMNNENIDINGGIEDILKDIPEDLKKQIEERKAEAEELDIPEEQMDCILMDLLYLENNDRKPGENNKDLYPVDWFDNPDYEKQFEILTEAVMEDKKIIETTKTIK